MLTPDSIPRTIDDAELIGWEGLTITCRCHIAVMSWPLLRRVQRYRRQDEIKERLVCSKCGSAPSEVTLHRSYLRVPNSVPETEKKAI